MVHRRNHARVRPADDIESCYPHVFPQHWEVVQWQDTRLWTVESGFESLLPSQPGVGGRGVRPKGAPTPEAKEISDEKKHDSARPDSLRSACSLSRKRQWPRWVPAGCPER